MDRALGMRSGPRPGMAAVRRALVSVAGFVVPLLAGFLGLVAFMYFTQDRLLYFPQAELVADPGRIGLSFDEVQLLTDDGETICLTDAGRLLANQVILELG